MTVQPFNPLDTDNLGISVAQALLAREPVRLDKLESFNGAGIYALYYVGNFPSYGRLVGHNKSGKFRAPIYVGKAENKRRKGGKSPSKSTVLRNRLIEHAESIQSVDNLRVEDFFARYLVVDDIWVPLGESLLIAKFSPVWNTLIDGFGNHDPGKGRYEGMRPRWDVLHPGRAWAEKCKERPESPKQIANDVEEYLRSASNFAPKFYVGEALGEYDIGAVGDKDEA